MGSMVSGSTYCVQSLFVNTARESHKLVLDLLKDLQARIIIIIIIILHYLQIIITTQRYITRKKNIGKKITQAMKRKCAQ